jgi:hypothetical protein
MKRYKLTKHITGAEGLHQSFGSADEIAHALGTHGLQDYKVFVLSCVSNNHPMTDEILVTESLPMMRDFVESWDNNYDEGGTNSFYLQEYDSYEDAYKVALDMREPNRLCYNNNETNQSK